MKKLLYAILILCWSSSTNQIYSTFIGGKGVEPFLAFGWFSLFAFIASVYTLRANRQINKIRSFFSLAAGSKKVLFLVVTLALSNFFSFYTVLLAITAVNPFIVVTFACLRILLDSFLSIKYFGDRIGSSFYFYGSFAISLVGSFMFYLASSKISGSVIQISLDGLSYILLNLFFSLLSDFIKRVLRRRYQIEPAGLMLLPYLAAALVGLSCYGSTVAENQPTLTAIAILLYIGVVPTAILGFRIQKLEDSLSIPKMKVLEMLSPLYILIAQTVIFGSSFLLATIYNSEIIRFPVPSLLQLFFSAVVVFGVCLSLIYGKPVDLQTPNSKPPQ